MARLRCPKCGYDLEGLRERTCPECGRPFDPAGLEARAERRRRRRRRAWSLLLLAACVYLPYAWLLFDD